MYFFIFCVRRSIDVLDPENQPGSGLGFIWTGSGSRALGLTEDVRHQKYENKKELACKIIQNIQLIVFQISSIIRGTEPWIRNSAKTGSTPLHLTIHRWTFAIYRWAFAIYRWTFAIYRWTFAIYRWTFDIYRWTFDIYRWTFDIYGWTFDIYSNYYWLYIIYRQTINIILTAIEFEILFIFILRDRLYVKRQTIYASIRY